jgi:hypothetical protein
MLSLIDKWNTIYSQIDIHDNVIAVLSEHAFYYQKQMQHWI